jgi:hypothetical protein
MQGEAEHRDKEIQVAGEINMSACISMAEVVVAHQPRVQMAQALKAVMVEPENFLQFSEPHLQAVAAVHSEVQLHQRIGA